MSITCRTCGQQGEPITPKSTYCSVPCWQAARRRTNQRHAQTSRNRSGSPRPPGTSQRVCPSCSIHYNVPRAALPNEGPVVVPIDRYQLAVLYRMAGEFLEVSPERVDVEDQCATCGRWSIVAFLDWLKGSILEGAA